MIPGYRIIRELGFGGMAVVYEADQIGLKRRVALKMGLDGPSHDAELLGRFQTEAEAAASLHHPNIVEIYEIGKTAGRPYFSMALIEGGTLAGEFGGRPASTRRAAQITEILALAIHYAHERGIVHRDLKPANVLLTPDGVPKIADFGLAKNLRDSGQTQSGTVLGSPCYMSPEQASGSVREAGPATDIYSLGAILYEMLVGAPPFKEATPLETLYKLLNDEPMKPTRLRPKVPRRPGDDLPEVSGKVSWPALWLGPRARGGPRSFLELRIGKGPPAHRPGTDLALVSAEDRAGLGAGPCHPRRHVDDRALDLPGRLPLPGCVPDRSGLEGGPGTSVAGQPDGGPTGL